MESLKATMTAMAMRTAEINSSEGLVPERPISANLRLQLCLIFVFTFLCIAQSNIMCYHYSISE